MEKRLTGTVRFYNDLGGFGFIRPDGSDYSLFVDGSGMLGGKRGRLVEGERVAFSLMPTERGPRANHVASIQVYAAAGD